VTETYEGRAREVLEEERDFFLRSLRDLEAERASGDIDEGDYMALRDDYTVRAAAILRQLEAPDVAAGAAPPAAEPPPAEEREVPDPGGTTPATPATPTRRPLSPRLRRRRRVLIGVAVVLIVGGIGWAAAGAAGVRLPGEEATGSNAGTAGLSKTDQLLVEAESAYGHGNLTGAISDYQKALKVSPDNVEALTGEGAILLAAGESSGKKSLVTEGMDQLQRAELADPSYGPAYGYRGLGYYNAKNYKAAIPQLETYLNDTPKKSRSKTVTAALAKAKAKVAAAG